MKRTRLLHTVICCIIGVVSGMLILNAVLNYDTYSAVLAGFLIAAFVLNILCGPDKE